MIVVHYLLLLFVCRFHGLPVVTYNVHVAPSQPLIRPNHPAPVTRPKKSNHPIPKQNDMAIHTNHIHRPQKTTHPKEIQKTAKQTEEDEFRNMASLLLYRMHSKDVTDEDLKYQMDLLVDIQKKKKDEPSLDTSLVRESENVVPWQSDLEQFLRSQESKIKATSASSKKLFQELVSNAKKATNSKDMSLFLTKLFDRFYDKKDAMVAQVVYEILSDSKLQRYVHPKDVQRFYSYSLSLEHILSRHWMKIKDVIEKTPFLFFYIQVS